MVDTLKELILGVLGPSFGPAKRYLVVSVINVFNHLTIFTIASEVWDWSAFWASLFAASISSVPAFILSRYWAWGEGGNSKFSLVLPFWSVAMLGLVVSMGLIAVADRLITNAGSSGSTVFLSYLGACVVAVGVGFAPAILLSRRWTKGIKDQTSFKAEIMPFWLIAMAGLLVSTVLVTVVDRTFDSLIVNQLATLAGYFFVWIAKFVILNNLFTTETQAEPKVPAG